MALAGRGHSAHAIAEANRRRKGLQDEALFVGDGETDILAASRAGLPCISVCYGYRTEEFLRSKGGNLFAHNVRELADLLNTEL